MARTRKSVSCGGASANLSTAIWKARKSAPIPVDASGGSVRDVDIVASVLDPRGGRRRPSDDARDAVAATVARGPPHQGRPPPGLGVGARH